jgi:hypothetical protein
MHPERRMAALSVVEDLKVVEERIGQLNAGAPSLTVQQLDLQPGPGRFRYRFVKGIVDRTRRGE